MEIPLPSSRFAAGEPDVAPAPTREGRVVAVCSSQRGGVPKYPQERLMVSQYGVEGDYHARPTVINRRTGAEEPNRRQVSVASKELYDSLGAELSITIPAGGFGENVLVEGLGDLSDLALGDRLRFSSGVLLSVTGQIGPCKNLSIYHRLVPRLSYGRRGVVAMVVQPGPVQPGDTVALHRVSSSRVPIPTLASP